MDTVERFLRAHAQITRFAAHAVRRDRGDDALEALLTAELRLLHELAAEAFGRERADAMLTAIGAVRH